MTSQQLFLRSYGLSAPPSVYYMIIGGGGYGGYTENPVYGAGGGSGADSNNYDAGPVSITKGTTYTVTIAGPNGTTSFGNLASAVGGYDAGLSPNGANGNNYWAGGSGVGNSSGGGGAGSRSSAQSADNESGKGGDGGSGTYFGNVPGRPGGDGLGGYYYSGGGGGGAIAGFQGAGIDGGGFGGWYNAPTGGGANTYGGGGGGAGWDNYNGTGRPGGAGGQGLLHIWYDGATYALPNSVNGASTGTVGNTRYYTFNGSGSITW